LFASSSGELGLKLHRSVSACPFRLSREESRAWIRIPPIASKAAAVLEEPHPRVSLWKAKPTFAQSHVKRMRMKTTMRFPTVAVVAGLALTIYVCCYLHDTEHTLDFFVGATTYRIPGFEVESSIGGVPQPNLRRYFYAPIYYLDRHFFRPRYWESNNASSQPHA